MRDPGLLFGSKSKSTRSGGHFTLADLDTAMSSGQMVVKKQKNFPSIPTMRAPIYLTVKTPRSRKRKTFGAVDMCLENLSIEDSLRKLISFSQAVR